MSKFKVGIDGYCLEPLGLDLFGALTWAKANSAEGVQFSGPKLPPGRESDRGLLRELAAQANALGLYLEWGGGQHIPYDMWNKWRAHDTFAVNRQAAEQASILGCRVVRSCSGGLMRWHDDAPATDWLISETARSLKEQKSMLQDHGVLLALETHYEFTTFELLRLFDMCGAAPGEYLGICLDTMNLLTMLEDPLAGTRRVLPWVVATHIKDGGVLVRGNGLLSFPAGIGKGVIDLKQIVTLLAPSAQAVNLSIEDHGGEFTIPVFDFNFLSRFPNLTAAEFATLLNLAYKTKMKMDEAGLSIVPRSEWPAICEGRVKEDIQNLRQMVKRTIDGLQPFP